MQIGDWFVSGTIITGLLIIWWIKTWRKNEDKERGKQNDNEVKLVG